MVCEADWEGLIDEIPDSEEALTTNESVSVLLGFCPLSPAPESSCSASRLLRPSFPNSPHAHPQSMRALKRAPSPSCKAVERLLASSRSLVARCSSQACSSDWAALSLDEVENVKESEPVSTSDGTKEISSYQLTRGWRILIIA